MRKRAGLSAEELASLCNAAGSGVNITRNIITGIENGKRSTVTLAELLIFAHALKIPPVYLVFPAQKPAADIEGLPGQTGKVYEFVNWFNGDPWASTFQLDDGQLMDSSKHAWISLHERREAERSFNILDDLISLLDEVDESKPPTARQKSSLIQIDSKLADLHRRYSMLRELRVDMYPLREDFEVEAYSRRLNAQAFASWDDDARSSMESIKSTLRAIIEDQL